MLGIENWESWSQNGNWYLLRKRPQFLYQWQTPGVCMGSKQLWAARNWKSIQLKCANQSQRYWSIRGRLRGWGRRWRAPLNCKDQKWVDILLGQKRWRLAWNRRYIWRISSPKKIGGGSKTQIRTRSIGIATDTSRGWGASWWKQNSIVKKGKEKRYEEKRGRRVEIHKVFLQTSVGWWSLEVGTWNRRWRIISQETSQASRCKGKLLLCSMQRRSLLLGIWWKLCAWQ